MLQDKIIITTIIVIGNNVTEFKYQMMVFLSSKCYAHDITTFIFLENIAPPIIPTTIPEIRVIANDNGSVCRKLGIRFCTTVLRGAPNSLSNVSVSIGKSRI
jgi:hypothetical protein